MKEKIKKIRFKVILLSVLDIILALIFLFAPIIRISDEKNNVSISPMEYFSGDGTVELNNGEKSYTVDFAFKQYYDFSQDVKIVVFGLILVSIISWFAEYYYNCKKGTIEQKSAFLLTLPLNITGKLHFLAILTPMIYLYLQQKFSVKQALQALENEGATVLNSVSISFIPILIAAIVLLFPTVLMASNLKEEIIEHFFPDLSEEEDK